MHGTNYPSNIISNVETTWEEVGRRKCDKEPSAKPIENVTLPFCQSSCLGSSEVCVGVSYDSEHKDCYNCHNDELQENPSFSFYRRPESIVL